MMRPTQKNKWVGCPHCQKVSGQLKNGAGSSGEKRMKCKFCGHTYAAAPKERGYSKEIRLKAIRCYLDGMNYRSIGRLLGINHQTVINWVNSYDERVKEQIDALSQQGASNGHSQDKSKWGEFQLGMNLDGVDT